MIKKFSSYPHFTFICCICVLVRIIFASVFADFQTDYYWEYGEIGKNILSGKGYSLFYFQNDGLQHRVSEKIVPYPSAYMPPGYVAIMLPFLTIADSILRNILIILTHTFVSLITVIALYVLVRKYISETTAIISCYLFSVLPDFFYAVISFTPTIFFQCSIVFVLLFLYSKQDSAIFLVFLGSLISFIVYLRSEFVVFLLLLNGAFAYSREWKKLIYIVVVVILCLAPWSVRNYEVLHTFVPLTTSMGLNLYRGNNASEIGAWGDTTTNEKLKSLDRNEMFEIELNDMFLQTAVVYIKAHPVEVVASIPVKLFDLWIYNRHSERVNWYYNVYSLIFSILFFLGAARSVTFKHVYFYIFFVYFSIVVSVFFCLPRYQTMMRIGMIPFAAIGIEYILSLFNEKIHPKT